MKGQMQYITPAILAVTVVVGALLTTNALSGFQIYKDSLYGYYPLDSSAQDSSGNNRHGIITGAVSVADGKFGGAYRFDGVKSYINFGEYKTVKTAYTISLWFKAEGDGRIFQNGKSGSCFYNPAISITNNKLIVSESGCSSKGRIGGQTYLGLNFKIGDWNHVAVTRDGVVVRVYINGELKQVDTDQPSSSGGSGLITIGASYSYTNFFKGLIDEVSLWDKVLTNDEIKAIYQQTQAIPITQLTSTPSPITMPSPLPSSTTIISPVKTPYPTISPVTSQSIASISPTISPGASESPIITASILPTVSTTTSQSPSPTSEIFQSPVSTTDVFAQYHLDSSAKDSSGNNRDGTISNAIPVAEGKFGGAYQFDGKKSYINFGAYKTLKTAYTVSLWFKADTLNGKLTQTSQGRIFQSGQASLCFYNPSISIETGKLVVSESGCSSKGRIGGKTNPGLAFNVDDWNHVAVTRDGVVVRVYINGELKQVDTDQPNPLNPGGFITIGAAWNSNTAKYVSFFKGLIDEVGLWDRILTDNEIKSIYQQNLVVTTPSPSPTIEMPQSVSTTNMFALYTFDSSAKDSSGNNRDGTISNAIPVAEGKFGGAYQFDGKKSYINFGAYKTLKTAYTVSLWFKANGNGRIFQNGQSSYCFYNPAILITNNKLIVSESSCSSNGRIGGKTNPGLDFKIGDWNHVTVTRDDKIVNVYLNGELKLTDTDQPNPINKGGYITIGAAWNSNTAKYVEFFKGLIDEVGLWDRVLTEDEVKLIYQKNLVDATTIPLIPTSSLTQLPEDVCGSIKNIVCQSGYSCNYDVYGRTEKQNPDEIGLCREIIEPEIPQLITESATPILGLLVSQEPSPSPVLIGEFVQFGQEKMIGGQKVVFEEKSVGIVSIIINGQLAELSSGESFIVNNFLLTVNNVLDNSVDITVGTTEIKPVTMEEFVNVLETKTQLDQEQKDSLNSMGAFLTLLNSLDIIG